VATAGAGIYAQRPSRGSDRWADVVTSRPMPQLWQLKSSRGNLRACIRWKSRGWAEAFSYSTALRIVESLD